jgi:acyl-CoA thioester hydrolase
VTPTPFEHRLRVRYAETDQMGVVYHANYLVYMDEARTMFLGRLGRDYAELERAGVGLAVRRAEVRYRAPARYGDELDVRVLVQRVGGASVTFAYELRRAAADSASEGRLLASGLTELACIDLTRPERPVRMLPADLRALLDER